MRIQHLSLLPLAVAVSSTAPKRVAIVGAGAAGSSAAYHLSQYSVNASISVSIDIYERSNYIGGRTTTVKAWGDGMDVELGGSIFVDANRIMMAAVREFNLELAEEEDGMSEGPGLGVWDGERFVLVTGSEDGWWDKAKLLWRYGLAPLRVNRLMKAAVGAFLTLYDEPIFPWKSVGDVVEGSGLLALTGVTGQQYLAANNVGDLFAREIVQASSRVNYASNLAHIHGLETMVCMATAGAKAVAGGNWRIFAKMLEVSGASKHLETAVECVKKLDNGSYTISTSTGASAVYDSIILASPLQFSNLTFSPALETSPEPIPYVRLHVTLFASPLKMSPEAFNLPAGSTVPSYVLTTLKETEDPIDKDPGSPGFWSISQHYRGVNAHATPPREEYVYKIFSPEPVGADFLSRILGARVSDAEAEGKERNGKVSWMYRKEWDSYPREYPRVTFGDVQLDKDLFYTSAFEPVISSMETSALSGMNAARLVRDSWVSDAIGDENQVTADEEDLREAQEL